MQLVMDGKVMDGITTVYMNATHGFFYLLFFFITAGIAYMKTQSIIIPVLFGLLYSAVGVAYLPPESYELIVIVISISVFSIIYRLWQSRR